MDRAAVISVDGHVKASRDGFREYIETRYVERYDDWVCSVEGTPDGDNLNPAIGETAQWDSDRRLADLESNGVVAEVLFTNGLPFRSGTPRGGAIDPVLARQGRLAYNRWLADFCAAAPRRRAGQAVISFDDIDAAVADVHWAAGHGLGGIAMPALEPGGVFFFDPVLDPVWAACEDVGLPISQHGGLGAPAYEPPGFAAILTLALEHSFYSGRSLWQMVLGGVFDRFPGLQVVFVETGTIWIPQMLRELDRFLGKGDDWTGFAAFLARERQFNRRGADYWEQNCHAGASPFGPHDLRALEPITVDGDETVRVGPHKMMFGVDYPHFETIYPHTAPAVADLIGNHGLSEVEVRGILYQNAAAVYGFDLEALAPDIERIGFELAAEVPAPA
ncbi:MAG TPA: amidohydrolase family protein [Acidimicrobiales bacterium]|nr:amidohydrolase family protein [Acidimicrobiales bacterium]